MRLKVVVLMGGKSSEHEVSLFPQAAKVAGLEFPQLLDHLINLALEK